MLMMEQKAIQTKKTTLKEAFLTNKYRRTKSHTYKHSCNTGANKLEEYLKLEKNLTLEQAQTMLIENKNLDPVVLLDGYLTFLRTYTRKNGKSFTNGAIRTYMILAKELLRFMGCKIYDEDFRQKIKLPPKEEVEEELLTKEIINQVLRNSSPKLQTVVLMLCSSAMRIGELVQLKLSDFDFSTNPVTINLRKSIVKGKIQPRKTQLTTEATKALKDHLARKDLDYSNPKHQEKFLFLQTHEERLANYERILENEKLYPQYREGIIKDKIPKLQAQLKNLIEEERYNLSVDATKNSFETLLERTVDAIPELSKKNENNRRNIHFHAFRYFFKTQVTDSFNGDFAEALMGHKSVRLRYYKQNDKKRLEHYRKVEPALTISDFAKVEKNIEQVTENYQDMKEQLKNLQEQFNILLAQTRPQKA